VDISLSTLRAVISVIRSTVAQNKQLANLLDTMMPI
jgi:hypothetical protein